MGGLLLNIVVEEEVNEWSLRMYWKTLAKATKEKPQRNMNLLETGNTYVKWNFGGGPGPSLVSQEIACRLNPYPPPCPSY